MDTLKTNMKQKKYLQAKSDKFVSSLNLNFSHLKDRFYLKVFHIHSPIIWFLMGEKAEIFTNHIYSLSLAH